MMPYRCRHFFILAVLALARPAWADTPAAIDSFRLPNGLEVIVIENHRVPVVAHMLWYRVGAANDPMGQSGLAHYHEHMMYQGTAVHPAGQYADLVESRGGQQNAFTTADATAYHITIAKDQLPLAMTLEADRMRGIAPRAFDAEKEKEVILEERRQRIENIPEALMNEQMIAALFRHHPYRVPVIGWMHEIEGLRRENAVQFHRAWYAPNNAILVLSGDITAAEARPLVEKYYGRLGRRALPPRTWTEEPPQRTARRIVMHHANVEQPLWLRYYAAPSLGFGRKTQALPLLALSQLLGGGKSSRLYRALAVDKKLASAVDVDYDAFTLGPSRFRIVVTPEPGVTMAAIDAAVDGELDAARRDGFGGEDIARARTLLKAQAVYARDGLSDMARIMGWIRIVGLEKEYFLRWPQEIDAVTAADILSAAKETLRREQSVTGWLLPEEKKEKE